MLDFRPVSNWPMTGLEFRSERKTSRTNRHPMLIRFATPIRVSQRNDFAGSLAFNSYQRLAYSAYTGRRT